MPEIYEPREPDADPSFEAAFRRDQRKLADGSKGMFPCPDCGLENSITYEMKRRGYHCARCTQELEQGF